MASSDKLAQLAQQFENAFVLTLSLTLVTSNAAPPGTAVSVFLLACVAAFLGVFSQRMTTTLQQESTERRVIVDLANHLLLMGASLSTTIVSSFLGNYSSALLMSIDSTPMQIGVLLMAATLLYAIQNLLVKPALD